MLSSFPGRWLRGLAGVRSMLPTDRTCTGSDSSDMSTWSLVTWRTSTDTPGVDGDRDRRRRLFRSTGRSSPQRRSGGGPPGDSPGGPSCGWSRSPPGFFRAAVRASAARTAPWSTELVSCGTLPVALGQADEHLQGVLVRLRVADLRICGDRTGSRGRRCRRHRGDAMLGSRLLLRRSRRSGVGQQGDRSPVRSFPERRPACPFPSIAFASTPVWASRPPASSWARSWAAASDYLEARASGPAGDAGRRVTERLRHHVVLLEPG